MQLTVRQVARLLGTDEKQIYRWVDEAKIPFKHVDGQFRFNRAELLEWATAQRLPVSVEAFRDMETTGPLPVLPGLGGASALSAALELGGVHHGVGGRDRESVIRAVVDRMQLPDEFDRELLVQVLLARETLGATCLGDGIAIPHVRRPVVESTAPASVTLCFLEHPVDFGAFDGKPVHTLFAMVSPTIRVHLELLARLSAALGDAGFKAAVLRRAPAAEILAEARRVELAFSAAAPTDGTAAKEGSGLRVEGSNK